MPTPTVAYLILSHTNPAQVARLARVLAAGPAPSEVFIRHDRAGGALDPALLGGAGNIHLLDASLPTVWGGFSLVEATLRGMEAIERTAAYDWLTLVSGQDYPIKPLGAIHDALGGAGADALIAGVPVRGPEPCSPISCNKRAGVPGGCRHCVERYHFRHYHFPRLDFSGPRQALLRRALGRAADIVNALQPVVKVSPTFVWRAGVGTHVIVRRPPAELPGGLTCYKGFQWFSLSRRAARAVLGFVRDNPRFVAHYRRTFIPDESFFQTILMNTPGLRVSPDDRRLVNWGDDWGQGSPQVFGRGDFDRLAAAGQHFARKFDQARDAEILDLIDARLL